MSNFKELVRAGKDAEVRYTQNGKSVAAFSAAFASGWGNNKQTVWLDCSYWGERGEKVAPYIKKGNQLVVEGDLGMREYEGKTYLTLRVTDIRLVSGKRGSGPANDEQKAAVAARDFSDDIPFAWNNGHW